VASVLGSRKRILEARMGEGFLVEVEPAGWLDSEGSRTGCRTSRMSEVFAVCHVPCLCHDPDVRLQAAREPPEAFF